MRLSSFSWLVVFVLAAQGLFAQKNYLVTIKGDTLAGDVKILSYDLIDRLQIVVNGKKTSFTATQVRGFVLENETYRTIKMEGAYRFMKLIRPGGYMSLYAFRSPNQTSYDGSFLVKKDASSMEVPNLTFKRGMTSFLEDCPSVSTKIKNGEYGKRDLDKIIDLYNACIEQKSQQKTEPATPVVVTAPVNNDKLLSLDSFIKEVESTPDFSSKKDALDLLKDIHSKVSKNEAIPNYLYDGLKSYLAGQNTLVNSTDKTIALLKK